MTTLSRDLQKVLQRAMTYATERRHEFATLEHLLLSLVEDESIQDILTACAVNIPLLTEELTKYLDNELQECLTAQPVEVKPTNGFQRVVQRALIHVRSAGHDEVTASNVLVTLFAENDSVAVTLLEEQELSRFDVVNYIAHGTGRESGEIQFNLASDSDAAKQNQEKLDTSKILEKYCINLTARATEGKIDPVVGRKPEMDRAMQVLCRRRKHNPLFVGEAGVGKTAVAEGLAQRIVDGDVPSSLEGAELYQLDIARVLAGTRYRGDFEERVTDIVGALKQSSNSVVFIDEIHTVVGSGSTSGGAMDMANLLKPALQSGDIRCMGATTNAEYRKHFEKDRALARRFQKIDIAEPSVDLTIRILSGLKSRLEEHHDVRYTSSAVRDAAKLSHRYIQDRFLPDKAIDVLDETGAYYQIIQGKNSTGSDGEPRRRRINSRDVERTIAVMAKVPSHTLTRSEGEKLENLSADLKRLVFGQDTAVDTLTTAIKQSRAGLRDPAKPIGSYLFCGPTGVGKTEVARQLAAHMRVPLTRFDMSEYMEPHSVARLIGAPPGYVGHDYGGLLTESLNSNPHCVLLLDEIEKAHADVFNVLLQVMDYGTLTDSSGRVVRFNNTIIIMTSNAGAASIARHPIGFGGTQGSGDAGEAVAKIFPPEFRNRLDAMVSFTSLTLPDVELIVDKMMMELEGQLSERQVEIQIDAAARKWLAQKGFDPALGARPLSRLIAEHIKKPLSDELLFGKVKLGGKVSIVLDQSSKKGSDGLSLEYTPRTAKTKNRSTPGWRSRQKVRGGSAVVPNP